MKESLHLHFSDKSVSYETFMSDLSARITRNMKSDANDPEYISQRKAYEMFGRRNIERWKRNGLITPCIRPGKKEYCTADLRLLQRTEQDYLNE